MLSWRQPAACRQPQNRHLPRRQPGLLEPIHQRCGVQPPQVLKKLEDSVDQVLLAIPSLSRSERRHIVDDLQRSGIAVLQVPSVDDLTAGRAYRCPEAHRY